MKILHVVSQDSLGYLQKPLFHLLSQQVKQGLDVGLLYIIPDEDKRYHLPEIENLPVYTVDRLKGFDFSLFGKIRYLIKQQGIDIVHSHDQQASLYSGCAALGTKAATVATRHEDFEKDMASVFWALQRKIIFSTDMLKQNFVAKHKSLKKKLKVIYNGLLKPSARRSDGNNTALRKKLGLLEQALIMVNVGPLIDQMDQATAIKSFAKLIKKELNAQLIFCGDGPLKEALQKTAREYKADHRVKFFDADTDIAEILQVADVFVYPAFRIGYPYIIIEALAFGVPVITTNIEANAEFIVERENGHLVPCGFPERINSAVMRLTAVKDILPQMKKDARSSFEKKFLIDQTASQYTQLYQQLTG